MACCNLNLCASFLSRLAYSLQPRPELCRPSSLTAWPQLGAARATARSVMATTHSTQCRGKGPAARARPGSRPARPRGVGTGAQRGARALLPRPGVQRVRADAEPRRARGRLPRRRLRQLRGGRVHGGPRVVGGHEAADQHLRARRRRREPSPGSVAAQPAGRARSFQQQQSSSSAEVQQERRARAPAARTGARTGRS